MAQGGMFGGSVNVNPRVLMAERLMAEGSSAAPVQHWTQGLNRMAQSLLGARMAGQVQNEEQAALAALTQGIGAKQWINPDTGTAMVRASKSPGAAMVPSPDAGGYTGAIAALDKLPDNYTAKNLSQRLLLGQFETALTNEAEMNLLKARYGLEADYEATQTQAANEFEAKQKELDRKAAMERVRFKALNPDGAGGSGAPPGMEVRDGILRNRPGYVDALTQRNVWQFRQNPDGSFDPIWNMRPPASPGADEMGPGASPGADEMGPGASPGGDENGQPPKITSSPFDMSGTGVYDGLASIISRGPGQFANLTSDQQAAADARLTMLRDLVPKVLRETGRSNQAEDTRALAILGGGMFESTENRTALFNQLRETLTQTYVNNQQLLGDTRVRAADKSKILLQQKQIELVGNLIGPAAVEDSTGVFPYSQEEKNLMNRYLDNAIP